MVEGIRTEVRRDPTPQEIARLCREIQAEWNPQTERSRRVTQVLPVELPRASRSDRAGDIEWAS
jgi:hypothetical protein